MNKLLKGNNAKMSILASLKQGVVVEYTFILSTGELAWFRGTLVEIDEDSREPDKIMAKVTWNDPTSSTYDNKVYWIFDKKLHYNSDNSDVWSANMWLMTHTHINTPSVGKKRGRPKSVWDDFCYICGGEGDALLCCDSVKCRKVAHVECMHLKGIPEGDWYCAKCAPPPPPPNEAIIGPKTLQVLELFKGTGSVTKYCARYPEKFASVISVDNVTAFNPTHICDVREWNYGQYPPGHFDIIFASPPCTEFSRLKTRGVRDLKLAKDLVVITQEIINYFQPRMWFIENPATGLLPQQEYMRDVPFFDVDYCKYSDFGYRKRTRIWSNIANFKPLICNKDCNYIESGKHINTFGSVSTISLEQKYRIPDMLLHKMFWHGLQGMKGFENKFI